MTHSTRKFDVAIIGAGPAGSTAAMRAARRGMSVIVLEKESHPRFHIGESLLPRNLTLLRELGLLDRVRSLPHVPKFGASFAMAGDDATVDFWFSPGPYGEDAETLNIERAPFDRLLRLVAEEQGALVVENAAVRRIDRLEDGEVRLDTDVGPVHARILLDASGQGTVVARHLGTRATLPDLKRVAYYAHFDGVPRREGRLGGSPIIVMADEGWFWVIPLNERRTSIGLVMGASMVKARGGPASAEAALAWGIERAPFMRRLMAGIDTPERNHVTADFSYRCAPFAGPGHLLIGDAATFVDPIFSTGVCMGMMSAVHAVECASMILAKPRRAARVRRNYARYVESSSSVFFRLVRRYYRHGFREMFLNGAGPLGVHRAVLSLLAGHVFPSPVFALRWRLHYFESLLEVHERWRPLVPRRERFSLLSSPPDQPPCERTSSDDLALMESLP